MVCNINIVNINSTILSKTAIRIIVTHNGAPAAKKWHSGVQTAPLDVWPAGRQHVQVKRRSAANKHVAQSHRRRTTASRECSTKNRTKSHQETTAWAATTIGTRKVKGFYGNASGRHSIGTKENYGRVGVEILLIIYCGIVVSIVCMYTVNI